jgi:hypothetical protein
VKVVEVSVTKKGKYLKDNVNKLETNGKIKKCQRLTKKNQLIL